MDRLIATTRKLGLDLQRHVQADKLSGQVLKVRTGRLRSSINLAVDNTATSVSATVGTNVSYASIHEFGVSHPWIIEARRGKALAFEVGGNTIFRKRVTHPPLPERSFLRSALRDMAPQIEAAYREAVAETVRE